MADEALVRRLEELLSSYLQSAGERELFQASELGRALVDSGTRPEQLLAAHVTAMGRILGRLPPAAVADGALRSYQMLLEALMAYFLAYRPPAPADDGDADEGAGRTVAGDYRDPFGLENLYQQASDRAAQFRDLVEVGNALVGAVGLSDAFERALRCAIELTGAATGAAWLINAEGRLEWRAGEMGGAASLLERLARQAFDGGEAVVEERRVAEEVGGSPSELALALPLTPPDGTPTGALAVLIVDGGADQSAQVLDLLRLLASQLGAVIGTAQLQEQLQRNVDALVTLNEIGEALVRTLDPQEVVDLVLDGAMRFPGVEAAAITPIEGWFSEAHAAVDEPGTLVRHAGDTSLDGVRAAVLESGKAGHLPAEPGSRAGELWVLPLRAGDRSLGTLEVHLWPVDTFPHLPTLESLAHHCASAIENARLYQSALAHEAALQDLVSKLITAQEEERRRVAYDIHDGLAQTAAATFQQLQLLAASYRSRSPVARSYLEGALHAGQRAVSEAREVIAGLRPTVLDDFGLAAAIGREVENLRRDGREVTFDDRVGTARFASEIETTLYRVVQESLTNIRKHAGPSPVRVTIERVDHALRLEVRDWGRGFAPGDEDAAARTDRVGLAGMRERMTLVRGTFSIAGSPEEGTTITAEVPVSLT